MKESFVIYTSFYEPIKGLSDKQLGRIFRALFDYQLGNGVQVEDDIKMAFLFFKNQMDIDGKKYMDICEKRKQAAAKGGAPKGNNNARKKTTESDVNNQNNQMVDKTTKTTYNDNDNVNDNVNENDSKKEKKKKRKKRDSAGTNQEPPPWVNDFAVYKAEVDAAYIKIINDAAFIKEREKYHPNLNIPLSLEKAYIDFWGNELGWEWKKSQKDQDGKNDWKATFRNALNLSRNQVYKARDQHPTLFSEPLRPSL